jgi:hypothetical protein
MDDQRLLREQLAELMIEHEDAQLATRRAAASVPSPATTEALAGWTAALKREQQIATSLREVRYKLTSLLLH